MSAKLSNKKVLYISDSLGTPIHPRGIFNYSMSIVTMLKELGANLTLLVERPEDYGYPDFCYADDFLRPAVQSSGLSEIIRYYNSSLFSFDWKMSKKAKERASSPRNFTYIPNRVGCVDFKLKKGAHLDIFDGFLWASKIYSDSMCYAVNNEAPIEVNASGYDYVFIDTPHYVKVSSVDPKHIFCVVHDLIPFRDPTMSWDWRTLFFQKMRATVALSGNMIFVSKYTQKLFDEDISYPYLKSKSIIYPTLTEKSISNAAINSGSKGAYARDIADHRNNVIREAVVQRLNHSGGDASLDGQSYKTAEEAIYKWNGDLPYFCTIVSDEPRKNIDLFVKVAKEFIGRANFLVVGQVDGNRYMENRPDLYPNLHFTGFIDDGRKNDIVKGASGLVFPSFAEGFGIPVIEGALHGVPTLCSDIDVFREITDNKAIYFDPYSVDDLSSQISAVIDSSEPIKTDLLSKFVLDTFSQKTMQKALDDIFSKAG